MHMHVATRCCAHVYQPLGPERSGGKHQNLHSCNAVHASTLSVSVLILCNLHKKLRLLKYQSDRGVQGGSDNFLVTSLK